MTSKLATFTAKFYKIVRVPLCSIILSVLIGLPFATLADAEHTFLDPRVGDLPIDRCEASGNLATRCRSEVQQRIADFFCSQHNYQSGAEKFTLKFVGPLPQSVVMFRDGSPPKFVTHIPHITGSGGIDVFSLISCRTRLDTPKLQTERFPLTPVVPNGARRVDKCMGNHPDFDFFSRCNPAAQETVADGFCRILRNAEEAVSWEIESDVGNHAVYDHLSGNFFSNIWGGDAIKNLTCKWATPPFPNLPRRFSPIRPLTPSRP